MSVLKKLYNHVKTIITTDVTEVKHFDYWNENINNQDISTSYATPAVFFEYSLVEWEEPSKGSLDECTDKYPNQQGMVDFTLHVVIRKNESSAIDASELMHFDISDAVYKALSFTTFDEMEGHIIRLREQDDINNRVLRDWQITFRCHLLELGGTEIGDEIIDANDPIGTIDFEAPIDPQIDQPFIDGDNDIHFNIQ
jgi:hypothetical protein